jgi:hypothetical protein
MSAALRTAGYYAAGAQTQMIRNLARGKRRTQLSGMSPQQHKMPVNNMRCALFKH